MSTQDLTNAIAMYGAGLEAELTLLRQLQRLAAAQHDATRTHDLDSLNRVADDRERVMASLVALEHELKPIRQQLSENKTDAMRATGFEDLVVLHRAAASLVASILSADGETMHALREAELARRFASQAIESGQSTLAAYRRVIAPPLSNAALVDRRG